MIINIYHPSNKFKINIYEKKHLTYSVIWKKRLKTGRFFEFN